MRRSVKLPIDILGEALAACAATGRTLEEQIARWAELGRDADPEVGRPARKGAPSLAKILDEVGAPKGRRRLRAYLRTTPFPHFEGVPGRKDLLIRIDADGTRTRGKFVGKRFKPC
jgi:hypothetical protein